MTLSPEPLSAWHWEGEDGPPDDPATDVNAGSSPNQEPDTSLTGNVIRVNGDLIRLAADLRDDGVCSEDVVDVLRDRALTKGQLLRILTKVGYSKGEVWKGLKHFSKGCSHQGGGEIGSLPLYPSSRPRIDARVRDIRHSSNDAWQAVLQANDPPQFFSFGGNATYVVSSDTQQTELVVLSENSKKMLHLIGEVGEWFKPTQQGDRPARPPKDVADHMCQTPNPVLPHLRRLARMPIFDRGGRLVMRPGYHGESQIFLAPKHLQVPRVSHAPLPQEVERAKKLIIEELLGDFLFVGEVDLINAVSVILLPFVREMIKGPTPLYVITKPTPGSGGTLLAQVLSVPATGDVPVMSTLPNNESEIQRRITSVLLTSPAVVIFDNIPTNAVLSSAHLASAVTSTKWQDRPVGTHAAPVLPITNSWVATGNNVATTDEIARRVIPIRLDPKMENPWERTEFRHDLPSWALEHRDELVWAALTLAQTWIAKGMPTGSLRVGMYESWSGVMSGILDAVGMPGLNKNWHEWNGSRPSAEKDLTEAVMPWWEEFSTTEVRAAELLPVIGPALGIPPEGGRSSATLLGTRLRSVIGRTIDGLEIVGREASGSMLWRLRVMDEGSDAEDS